MPIFNRQLRLRARQVLSADLQTALLVAFFAGIFQTALQVIQGMTLNYDMLLAISEGRIPEIPQNSIYAFGICILFIIIFSPMLDVACKKYFIDRFKGKTPAFLSLFDYRKKWFKSIILYAYIFLLMLLWAIIPSVAVLALLYFDIVPVAWISTLSMLLAIPVFLAYMRYYQAPYIFASNPKTTVFECVKQSKKMMKNHTPALLGLLCFFYLLSLFSMLLSNMFVSAIGTIISLALSLLIHVYQSATTAGFYLIVDVSSGFSVDKDMKDKKDKEEE